MHFGRIGEPGAYGVNVRIDQSRNDGAAGKIDLPRSGAAHRCDPLSIADSDDAAVPDGNCLGFRVRRIERDDPAVQEDRIGGLRVNRTRKRPCSNRRDRKSEPEWRGIATSPLTTAAACN